jgi:hypothetical protein
MTRWRSTIAGSGPGYWGRLSGLDIGSEARC